MAARDAAIDLREVRVVDRPQRSRYELVRGGDVLGFIDYILTSDAVVLTHAEVRPELRGQGLGEWMAAGALGILAAARRPVVARCAFVSRYLRAHPEVAARLPSVDRPRIAG